MMSRTELRMPFLLLQDKHAAALSARIAHLERQISGLQAEAQDARAKGAEKVGLLSLTPLGASQSLLPSAQMLVGASKQVDILVKLRGI